MATCKKCGEEIEWQEVQGIWYPLDPGTVYYEELKIGQRLLTIGGNVFSYLEDKRLPSVHGRLIHHDTCKSRG